MTGWVEYQSRRQSKGEDREQGVPWYVGDKLKAYAFAQQHGVATPERYAQWAMPEDFDASKLPDRFVLKPKGMHSTHGVMLLNRQPDGTWRDLLRKRTLTTEAIKAEQRALWEKNLWKNSYCLFAEELLIGEDGNAEKVPFDYKLYCFNGSVEFITQVNRNVKPSAMSWWRGEFGAIDPDEFLTSDWAKIQRGEPMKPDCADDLIKAAKTLSAALKTPFVSVDMYATPRGPVLGELTLSPGGPYHGIMYKLLPHFNDYLGKCWTRAAADLMATA